MRIRRKTERFAKAGLCAPLFQCLTLCCVISLFYDADFDHAVDLFQSCRVDDGVGVDESVGVTLCGGGQSVRTERGAFLGKHGDAVLCLELRFEAGQVDGIDDVAVLDIVLQFVRRHDRAVVLRFFRRRAEVGHRYDAVAGVDIRGGEVADVLVQFAAGERRLDVGHHGEFAARGVDHHRAVRHFRYRGGIDHTFGFLGGGHMQGHEVRVLICFFGGGAHFNEGDLRFRRVGEVGIVALNVHAERVRRGGDLSAYRAEPQHRERLARDLVSDELFLALFHLFRHVVAGERGRPLYAFREVARGEHELAYHHFLDRIRVRARRVENDDSALCVIGMGDIVDARAGSCYGKHGGGQIVFRHIRASDEYARGGRALVDQVVSAQDLVRKRRDGVEFQNVHNDLTCFPFRTSS